MKKIIKNSIIIFLLSSIFHFIYNIFPNNITALLFPVNESIWEHFKLLYTTGIIFSILNIFITKEKNNFFLNTLLRSLLLVIILSIIYLPIYYLFGENLIVTLIILFITILITEYILSKINNKKHYKTLNLISAIVLIIIYITFMYLTYNPLYNSLFLDPQSKTYGLNK